MKANDYEGRRNISGERVRMKRLSMRLSQAALVAKVQTEGVVLEQDAISRIELGDRMVQDYELWALSSVLGVSADWFFVRRYDLNEKISPIGYKPMGAFFYDLERIDKFRLFMDY